MSNRHLPPDRSCALPQTRIYTRNALKPRDERVLLPKSVQRTRPLPINIAPGEPSPLLKTPPISSKEREEFCESPRAPEIVDLAAPNTWPRRATPQKRAFSRAAHSPSVASQRSARQSEISFGILDYYIRDPSPLQSPELPAQAPRIATPVLDPSIAKFDFGLSPSSPSPYSAAIEASHHKTAEAVPGAEQENSSNRTLPPLRPQLEQKNTYRLFPILKDTTPPGTSAGVGNRQSPRDCTMLSNITWVPSHHQPDPSYRPRKESLSSSIRSRKDSFNSFCGTKRIPMRIISGSSTYTSKTRSTASTSTTPASPPEGSRWSDDTITSPVAATTPGPRASFGSLLGRDSEQYPACFFEDDDDEFVPLRRKLLWKRSASVQEQQARRASRDEERDAFGMRLRSILLCGSCCSRGS